jgi:hypothetical protein
VKEGVRNMRGGIKIRDATTTKMETRGDKFGITDRGVSTSSSPNLELMKKNRHITEGGINE